MSLRALLAAALLAGCAPPPAEPQPTTCNGAAELCSRSVDQVAFLKTHNSHASEERGYSPLATNQFFAIPTQLRDGVRSLNVDVYEVDGELRTCHGYCELGSQAFEEVLDEVATFLDSHRNQVVLLDFQDETGPGTLAGFLATHRIQELAHAQTPGEPWPTLAALDGARTPLILLGNPQPGDPPWFNDAAALTYRTGWSYQTPAELDCAPADPVNPGALYEVVHVLTNPLAHPDNAEQINHQPAIGEHLDRCLAEVGFIHQVSVDYYSIGDALQAIDDLNGV